MCPNSHKLKCPNKNFIRELTLEKIFNMSEKELSIYDLMLKVKNRNITQMKASELLGISDRQFRRLWKAYNMYGAKGLISKKRGLPSNNKLPKVLNIKTIILLKKHYEGFGPTLANEKLKEKHNIEVSTETLRQWMIRAGLWKKKHRRKIQLHQSRLRRSHKGELIQVDGSPHDWFEGRSHKCCLLCFIDDATSSIMHLQFVNAESTETYFQSISNYLKKHGKPISFYTDRLSVFRVNNNKEGYRKSGLTQVGRALKELDIELICANSPQAKGRIERLFSTLQDRLVKELRLNNISSIEDGNKFLPKYMESHNAKFAVEAKKDEDLHREVSEREIVEAMRYKQQRTLTKNLELSYCNKIIQIKAERPLYTMIRAKVMVIESLDGKIEIQYQGKELKYKELLVKDSQGKILDKKQIATRVFPLGGKGHAMNL